MTGSYFLRTACALLLVCLAPGAVANECRSNEVLVDEDDDYDYCIKKTLVQDCNSKAAGVNKCINAGCVHTAGLLLKKQLAACNEQNDLCMQEQGAAAALIQALSTCIIGTAITADPAVCFGATAVGGIKHDNALYFCKRKFGNCMEPGLAQHKGFVKACAKFN